MKRDSKDGLPPAVILAGGFSQRMGFPKAFLALEEKSTVLNLVDEMIRSGFGRVALVVSREIADSANTVFSDDVEIIINSAPEEGMISSLRLALDWAQFAEKGLLAQPVDHPLVSVVSMSKIIEEAKSANIVIPVYEGKRGHPTWWGRDVWNLLRDPMCDEGAKPLLRGWNNLVVEVKTDDPGILQNINTTELARMHRLSQLSSTAN